jgi:hypothetical protein
MTTLSLGIMVPPKYLEDKRVFNAEERNKSLKERQLGGFKMFYDGAPRILLGSFNKDIFEN